MSKHDESINASLSSTQDIKKIFLHLRLCLQHNFFSVNQKMQVNAETTNKQQTNKQTFSNKKNCGDIKLEIL